MKTLRIFLFVLIIIGLGLLATQKMWVPKLVDYILKSENQNYKIAKLQSSDTFADRTPASNQVDTRPITDQEKNMIEVSIQKKFGIEWEGTIDGCGEGSLKKMRSITRTNVGFKVEIDYLCGFVMEGEPPQQTTVYVTTSGKVTGVPTSKY